jgi:hypothetical protein
MFNASRICRSAMLGALTCAVLAATAGNVAAAQTQDDAAIARALAQERYYMGVENEEAADALTPAESTLTRSAAAQPKDDAQCRVQLGAGLPFVPGDCEPQHKSDVARLDDSQRLTAAQAQERYYASYGEPEPINAPVAPAPADRTPWLTIVLAAALALAAGTLAAIHRRRLRLRRRVARATT